MADEVVAEFSYLINKMRSRKNEVFQRTKTVLGVCGVCGKI